MRVRRRAHFGIIDEIVFLFNIMIARCFHFCGRTSFEINKINVLLVSVFHSCDLDSAVCELPSKSATAETAHGCTLERNNIEPDLADPKFNGASHSRVTKSKSRAINAQHSFTLLPLAQRIAREHR